jgi:hypothetical protein
MASGQPYSLVVFIAGKESLEVITQKAGSALETIQDVVKMRTFPITVN